MTGYANFELPFVGSRRATNLAAVLACLLLPGLQAASMLAPPQWTTFRPEEAMETRKTHPQIAFRRVFEAKGAIVGAEWEGSGRVYLNGREVADGSACSVDASCFVGGRNLLAVALASNRAKRGFIGRLTMMLQDGSRQMIQTNGTGWLASKVAKEDVDKLSWLALDHDVQSWQRVDLFADGARPSWDAFRKDLARQIPLWADGKGPIGAGKTEPANAYLQVFQPAKPSGIAMVVCAGGGYGRNFWYGPEGVGTARWLSDHGITAAVLRYRLPKGNQERTLADVKRAIRYVRSQSEAWRIQPDKVGIIGFSAGGHLASVASTKYDLGKPDAHVGLGTISSRPDFAVLVYPVISLGEHSHKGTRKGWLGLTPTEEQIRAYSSHLQVSPETPPTFLTHASDDVMVPPVNSELYLSALKENNVAARYLSLPKGGHGFRLLDGGMGGKNWEPWRRAALAWIGETLL